MIKNQTETGGPLRTGIVSKVYGVYYNILPLPELKPVLRARLRGKLRLQKSRPENKNMRHLIMVGDHVEYRMAGGAMIESLLPRKNSILRASTHQTHCLGANLDHALLVVSLKSPTPKFHFVDRFLSCCSAGGVAPILFFTKSDLLTGREREILDFVSMYKALDYPVYCGNLLADDPGSEFRSLEQHLQAKTTLLAGNSGTGKSTLINRLLDTVVQKTAAISSHSDKGRHTTTNSTLLVDTPNNALYVDTPGVKEWGILHLSDNEIYHSYPELYSEEDCFYRDCEHKPKNEGCVIQIRLTDGHPSENDPEATFSNKMYIRPERRKSLLAMLESLKYSDKIRTGDYIKSTGRVRTGRIKDKK